MIVWLASYPRSGNTLARILINRIYGVGTYSIYDDPDFDRIGASEAVGHRRMPATPKEMDASPGVHFVKTHEIASSHPYGKAICVIRDGRDAVVSFAHYRESFGGDVFEPTLKDITASGEWERHVLSWISRPGSAVIKYEDLLRDPARVITDAVKEIGIKIVPGVPVSLPTFDELHARWPSFFRRGRVGNWKEEMPAVILDSFWASNSNGMEAAGYVRP